MKFNICVITGALPDIKGVPVLVNNFLKLMEPFSKNLYLITANYNSDLYIPPLKILNMKYDDKRESVIIRMFKFIILQFKMSYNLIKFRNQIDIVILFISTPFIVPMITAKIFGKKVIIIASGSSAESARYGYRKNLFGLGSFIISHIYKYIEKINYFLSDKIVVLSKSLIPYLELEKYDDKIDYGSASFIDVNHFSENVKFEDRKNMVGFIGRLTESKGIMEFIKAIELLSKEENLSFLIAGDGSLRGEVEKELLKKNLNNSVTFVGWISHKELPEYYNMLKLLVVPTYTDVIATTALEAMACGTPVLITSVGSVPDIIEDGKTGFILDNVSPESIVENVHRVLAYPDLENVVINGRKLLEKDYAYESVVKHYKMIIENLVK